MSEQTQSDSATSAPAADCRRCQHYYITHHVSFRYGCRALGFKSRRSPGAEVIAASGESCAYFSPKPTRGEPPLRR